MASCLAGMEADYYMQQIILKILFPASYKQITLTVSGQRFLP